MVNYSHFRFCKCAFDLQNILHKYISSYTVL